MRCGSLLGDGAHGMSCRPCRGCCELVPKWGAADMSMAMRARCVCSVLDSMSEVVTDMFVVLSLNCFG